MADVGHVSDFGDILRLGIAVCTCCVDLRFSSYSQGVGREVRAAPAGGQLKVVCFPCEQLLANIPQDHVENEHRAAHMVDFVKTLTKEAVDQLSAKGCVGFYGDVQTGDILILPPGWFIACAVWGDAPVGGVRAAFLPNTARAHANLSALHTQCAVQSLGPVVDLMVECEADRPKADPQAADPQAEEASG